MLMKALALLVAILALASVVQAGETTAAEKRFLKTLVSGLTSESRDVQQASAEGLVTMGEKSAVHLLDQWSRLKPAARDAAVPVLIRIGKPSADAILSLKRRPTGSAGKALDRIIDTFTGKGGNAGFGPVDARIAVAIRTIMGQLPKNEFSPDCPPVEEIVALGRVAIPALLTYLRPSADIRGTFPRDSAATAALSRLCSPDDAARLSFLLDDGWLKIAEVLQSLGNRSAVPALIRVLKRGKVSHEVARALAAFEDPRSAGPLLEFLERHGKAFPSGMDGLLDLAVKLRLRDAVPTLRAILATPSKLPFNQARQDMICARALMLLGDPTGIPVLIGLLDPGPNPGMDGWRAVVAGTALNAATGQTFWSEGASGAKVKADYEAWWEAHGSRLEWDEPRRVFGVK
jgi:PBS lyase HEAT-like repeat